ncbi:uncharacterized protein HMPREF1541_01187 [Cyphellophora europaea CBS 101466]|uniref:Tat pathway signal sequence n=1 Tax=Cyphellophora europaea (strain CBS 101466) TaxID=1220924 RepID=W2SE83_CYPE1|nr:uncharacterized protein HMPREF1541_01187 [Cyphellophora europaea CBS 101466]ETN46997.1 hypothetical protein HMPREF1541_01187 [Cyphellophora europaea CBS 101466]
MSNSHYSKIEADTDSSDHEALLSSPDASHSWSTSQPKGWLSWLSSPIVTLVLVCIAFATGFFIQAIPFFSKDSLCAAHTTQYTPPILSDVSIEYSSVDYNGSFLQENIYRRPASPEVDAAWEALGVNYRGIRVPEDQAVAAGISKSHVRINKKHGGGYPANVEGLHHLHCLNLLRQTSKYNFDYYKALGEGAFKNDDMIVEKHVTHCLDILRQQLMCRADFSVFGQVWTHPESPKPFVDFNTRHKCVNYDAIRQWAEERQLPKGVPKDFLEPPNEDSRIYPGTP